MIDHLLALIRREARKALQDRPGACLAYVSSYEPAGGRVKVLLQPWNTESGWLPLGALAVGNGSGVAAGPNIGDQVLVHYIGGSPAFVTLRAFFDGEALPVPAGEVWLSHASGSTVKLSNDGALTLAQGGATLSIDNAGAVNVQGRNGASVQISAAGAVTLSAENISLAATTALTLGAATISSSGAWAHSGALVVDGAISDSSGSVGVAP